MPHFLSDAIAIGAAWMPEAPLDRRHAVVTDSYVYKPQGQSESVAISQTGENLSSAAHHSYVAGSSCKDPQNFPHDHATTQFVVHYAVP